MKITYIYGAFHFHVHTDNINCDFADAVKSKVNEVKTEVKSEVKNQKDEEESKIFTGGETVYTYTVNFDEEKKDDSDKN